MTEAEKNDLMKAYLDLKAAGKLSPNLSDPSPGSIRDECLIVYRERHGPNDDIILRPFLRKTQDTDNRQKPGKLDIDKFRPLVTLLRGRKVDPHSKHYVLLAWLIGFQPGSGPSPDYPGANEATAQQEEPGTGTSPVVNKEPLVVQEIKQAPVNTDFVGKKVTKIRKATIIKAAIIALMIFVLAGLYLAYEGECMYWAGVQYEKCSCHLKKTDTAIIAFDAQKATLKKITRPDTITHSAVGRVWYIKINNSIEYYTAEGFHPVDTKKRLKPITIYIIDKYVKKPVLITEKTAGSTAGQPPAGDRQQQPAKKTFSPLRPDAPANVVLLNDGAFNKDVAVLVIDDHNDLQSDLSSKIASLYKGLGFSTTNSLFTPRFINSRYLKDVENSSSAILDKLKLPSYVKYIVIGRYSNAFETGEFTRFISRANLKVTVISCITRSELDAFHIAVANAYDDKDHAEQGAIEKLLTDYKTNHLNHLL
jgi:hypothetical protein